MKVPSGISTRIPAAASFVYSAASTFAFSTGRQKCEIDEYFVRIAMESLKDVFADQKVKIDTNVKILNALINFLFLYNSEIWTSKTARSDKIDMLQ